MTTVQTKITCKKCHCSYWGSSPQALKNQVNAGCREMVCTLLGEGNIKADPVLAAAENGFTLSKAAHQLGDLIMGRGRGSRKSRQTQTKQQPISAVVQRRSRAPKHIPEPMYYIEHDAPIMEHIYVK